MSTFCNISGKTAVAGVGYRQYKRGTAPSPERGVLVRAIVDACEDAGLDPADVDGFVSYGDDKNEPVRLMPDLGTKELRWSAQVWGGGGGGIAATFGLAASAIMTGQAKAVVVFRALAEGNSGRLAAASRATAAAIWSAWGSARRGRGRACQPSPAGSFSMSSGISR